MEKQKKIILTSDILKIRNILIRIIMSLLCIFSPFLFLVLAVYKYTTIKKFLFTFFPNDLHWVQSLGRIINFFSIWFATDHSAALKILFKTIINTLNFSLEALSLVACCFLAANLLFLRAKRADSNGFGLSFSSILIFGVFVFCTAFLFCPHLYWTLVFSLVATVGFLLNYPASEYAWKSGPKRKKSLFFAMPLLIFWGGGYILSPALLLESLAWCFSPESVNLRRYSVYLGRIIFCIVTLGVLVSILFSVRPRFMSDNAYHIISDYDLYYIVLDYKNKGVLVTKKRPEYTISHYMLPLHNVYSKQILFHIHSNEVEGLEIDDVNGVIYHVAKPDPNNNLPLRLVVMNSKSLEAIEIKHSTITSDTGSIKTVLTKDRSKLFISWEIGLLTKLDIVSNKIEPIIKFKSQPFLLLDEVNNLLYVSLAWHPRLFALDIHGNQLIRSVEAPIVNQLPALSAIRKEIYVPDPINSAIWVYKTPSLELSRKIKSEFGVRTIAVDDERGLLLACSYMTGNLKVIDIDTGKMVASHYLGPYSRALVLDKPRRRAFITLSNSGLFCLGY